MHTISVSRGNWGKKKKIIKCKDYCQATSQQLMYLSKWCPEATVGFQPHEWLLLSPINKDKPVKTSRWPIILNKVLEYRLIWLSHGRMAPTLILCDSVVKKESVGPSFWQMVSLDQRIHAYSSVCLNTIRWDKMHWFMATIQPLKFITNTIF